MRLIKMLGLGMVAAIAAMALVGVGSASAHSTALCKTNELPCKSPLPSGTAITGALESGTTAKLKSSIGTVECKKSPTSGKTTSGLATSVSGSITALKFEECKLGETSCTVTTEGLPYAASVLVIPGTMNGEFTVKNPSATVKCGALINCTFGFESVNLTVDGGAPAKLLAKEERLTLEKGFICPGESFWTATYTITAPNPLFISE